MFSYFGIYYIANIPHESMFKANNCEVYGHFHEWLEQRNGKMPEKVAILVFWHITIGGWDTLVRNP